VNVANDPIEGEEAEKQLRRQRLLVFLNSDEPAWRDEDHPDIVALGTAEWVRAMRNEVTERELEIEKKFAES
jgi:hypothetical protein